MGSSENPNWFLDSLIDDINVPEGDFAGTSGGFCWAPQGFNSSSDVRALYNSFVLFYPLLGPDVESLRQIDSSFTDSNGLKEPVTGKSARSETCGRPATKACREKFRRDRLNDRFLELGSLLEPGKPPKMDKAAILSDVARLLTQLRNEAQKLKESYETLQDKIKELKAEKNELRDEKQRLKAEKESLEQQIKLMNARSSYVPHPPVIPSPVTVQSQSAGHKLMMPIIGYPGFPMWQFMPPADVDTSQDADKCPPVA